MRVCGKEIHVGGRWLRTAYPVGDGYHFLEDPQPVLDALRKSKARVDLFTFMQKVSDVSPKHAYPMEWDNFAALPISTFDHWWNDQIGFKGRNKAKQAEKKGVVVREVPFDDRMIEGMWRIYNETPICQGKRFPHYGMTLERMRGYAGTFLDRSVFIGEFFENELVGFAKLT